MQKISWGVLGTATIALGSVIPAMQRGRFSTIAALASRDRTKARRAAEKLGIPKSCSYEELLEDRDIQAVYIPLPNHLHVPWTIRCLEAGKHVLCEKPLGISLGEVQRLRDTAQRYPHLKVMEGFMYRFHPQWGVIRNLLKDKAIGELRWIQSSFTYNNVDPADIRNRSDFGGGGLLDIGCYCISVSRFLFEAEPRRVFAEIELDPQTGIDRLTTGILEFDRGRSTFTCSTQLARFQRTELFGTEGKVEIDTPFNPPADRGPSVILRRGAERTTPAIEASDQFTLQGDLFSQAILNDTNVPTPLEDAVSNMRVIDGVFRSAKAREWFKL